MIELEENGNGIMVFGAMSFIICGVFYGLYSWKHDKEKEYVQCISRAVSQVQRAVKLNKCEGTPGMFFGEWKPDNPECFSVCRNADLYLFWGSTPGKDVINYKNYNLYLE